MRFWQKFALGCLSLLTLLTLGGTVAVVYRSWTRPVVLAVSPTQVPPSPSPQPTQTSDPTLPAAPTANPSPSSTPFQPLPITPTPTASPIPTATPTRTPLPTVTPTQPAGGVFIEGIWGYRQAFNLSCESRSAADFARYFGVEFTELEFLNALPITDNPETGFVGSVYGAIGQLPPFGYGVHAKPVARLMRDFGLDARAHKGMTLAELQAELAAGRPVMIWAIYDLGYSTPVEYTSSDGETTIVARFEHTFIVIGYGDGYITVLDNERIYSVSTEQFLTSWGVLGNMGITVGEDE